MRSDSSRKSVHSSPQQRHLFVIDPLESLTLELDSSVRLAREIEKAGHEIYVTTINRLGWINGAPSAHTHCARLAFSGSAVSFTCGAYSKRNLVDFAGIHMRKDPPFDLEYVSATWLLESAAGSAKIYNAPSALRSINEKLAIFAFPEASAAALVSSNPEELYQFIQNECHGDAIIKPLLLFGGRGVFRMELQQKDHATAMESLRQETQNGSAARLVQPFNKAIFEGEVRAFAVGGHPIAWCLKKPAAGNFLANTRAGATLVEYQPTKAEVTMATRVAQRLYAAGVSLVGFDLIGGVLSEVNITSPRLLQAPTDKRNYYESMAKWIIADASL